MFRKLIEHSGNVVIRRISLNWSSVGARVSRSASGARSHRQRTKKPLSQQRRWQSPKISFALKTTTRSGNSDGRGKADFSQKFGAQLKTKSDGEGVEPFFFGADDSRVVAALDFFFTDRPDLDKILEEFSARGRSELTLIFKRKARAKAQLLRPAKSKKHLGRFGGKRRMNTRGGGGFNKR